MCSNVNAVILDELRTLNSKILTNRRKISLYITYNTGVHISVFTTKSLIKCMSVTEKLTLSDGLSIYGMSL